MKDIKPGMQLLMLLAISACCIFLGGALGQIILLSYYNEEVPPIGEIKPMLVLVYYGVAHVFAHVVVFFTFLRVTKFKWLDLFPPVKFNWIYLLALPFIAVGGLLIVGYLSELSLSFFESQGYHNILHQKELQASEMMPLLLHNNPAQLILSVFVMAVLPAVGEELIYRGILQTRIQQATGHTHFAIVITAIIFSAMHFQPVDLLAIAFMGIVLGYVFVYSGNIWLSIALHFMFNAWQIIMAYVMPELFAE
ncbi:MAG: CPBP family intramembrane metalloprotease [Crocinitomicaceae bacterium]|nr:CPBP family intramembrane metalloprotease [Crocinitomicaceae bacterium]